MSDYKGNNYPNGFVKKQYHLKDNISLLLLYSSVQS